jgi:DNA-binding transcriptional LysR family regulator
MEIEDLNLFVRLAEVGSMSEAARQLDQTPAAVSARLKRMETSLGVRLFERTTRALRLTAEGESFRRTCQATLDAWRQGRGELAGDESDLAGKAHLAAPTDTSQQFLAPWLAEFSAKHPGLEIHVHVGDRMHDLPREPVDIAIRYGELADSTMVQRLLVRSERVLVASPAYVRRFGAPTTPADLMERRCLAWMSRDQPKVHWRFRSPTGAEESVVVRSALCGDSLLVRQWAIAGEGIAYKAGVDVAADIAAQRLVRLLPTFAGEPVPIHAVMPSGRFMPPRVRALLSLLAERFGALE